MYRYIIHCHSFFKCIPLCSGTSDISIKHVGAMRRNICAYTVFFLGFPLLHAVGWNFHFSMAPKSATAPKSAMAPKSAKTDATALAQALSILWVPWSWMKFACGACWMKQCRGTVGRWLLMRDCPEFQQGTPVCFTFSPDFGPWMFSFLGRRFPPTIRFSA